VLLTTVGNSYAGGDDFAERAYRDGQPGPCGRQDGWYGVVLEDAFLLYYLHQAVEGCELLAIFTEVTRLIPGGRAAQTSY